MMASRDIVLGKRKQPSTTNSTKQSSTKRNKPDASTPPRPAKKSPKSRGPPRPKTPLSYTTPTIPGLATAQPTTTTSTSSPPAPIPTPTRLSNTTHILTLLTRRNKNQHRTQPFWKHLSILRRNLTRLLNLHIQSVQNQQATTLATDTAASVRRAFETESHLRSQREVLESHVRENLVPAAYVAFSCLVADGQFANLGVVLMGVLAEVAGIVGAMRTKKVGVAPPRVRKEGEGLPGKGVEAGGVVVGTSTKATGSDRGEVVERVYDSSGGGGEDRDAGTLLARGSDGLSASEADDGGGGGCDVGTVVQREGSPDKPSSLVSHSREGGSSQLPHEIKIHESTSRSASPNPFSRSIREKTLTTKSERTASITADKHVARSVADIKSVNKPSRAREQVGGTTGSDRVAEKSLTTKPAEQRKKKKKANAIDDLFGGLI